MIYFYSFAFAEEQHIFILRHIILKKSAEELFTEFEEGFNELSMGENCVDEAELREYLEISERALRDRVSASKGKYFRKKGKVYKNEE